MLQDILFAIGSQIGRIFEFILGTGRRDAVKYPGAEVFA
jgi:hypothetical protein